MHATKYKFLPLFILLIATGCEDDTGGPRRLELKGDIHGHVCNPETQTFVPFADVSLEGKDSKGNIMDVYTTTSDSAGYFEFKNVYAGTTEEGDSSKQLATFTRNDGRSWDMDYSYEVTVVAGQDTSFEHPECVVPTGTVEGTICDERLGMWVNGARVYVQVRSGTIETETDENGYYKLSNVPHGDQTIIVRKGDLVDQYEVTVIADQTIQAGDSTCEAVDTNCITGRLCAGADSGSGYWLADARVYIEIGGVVFETTSDAGGYFHLDDIPVGEHTVRVERGSFSTEFSVTNAAGDQCTNIPEPQCIDPGQFRIAVVTGTFDKIEEILDELGFKAHKRFDPNNPFPNGELLDQNGTVDLIEGRGTQFYINDFLLDIDRMRQYDIIFFNCGLQELYFAGEPNAINNVKTYVEEGRSIYASDWASEIVRLSFPGKIDFLGAEEYKAAQQGQTTENNPAKVIDANLAAALGDTTPADGMDITINFNMSVWTVLEPANLQPAGTKVWVTGPAALESGNTVPDSAFMVSFDHGENGGKVVYTSFHNYVGSFGVNEYMNRILKYMIFEL